MDPHTSASNSGCAPPPSAARRVECFLSRETFVALLPQAVNPRRRAGQRKKLKSIPRSRLGYTSDPLCFGRDPVRTWRGMNIVALSKNFLVSHKVSCHSRIYIVVTGTNHNRPEITDHFSHRPSVRNLHTNTIVKVLAPVSAKRLNEDSIENNNGDAV